jgi:lysophospholipase L1-like esterase
MKYFLLHFRYLIAGGLLTLIPYHPASAEVQIHSGDTIAFLGDSITKQGSIPTGWCGLVVSGLEKAGVDASPINAGKGGHTSRDMVNRYEADVIARKPTWMILMCGTNDNPNHGLSLEESEKNVNVMVEKARSSGIKVLVATRPMRGGDTTENAYNAFLRNSAQKQGVLLADVFAAMKNAQENFRKEHPDAPPDAPFLTIADGTHMNPRGNQVIAECILSTLGLSPEQIASVKADWPDPNQIKGLSQEETSKDAAPAGGM